MHLARHQQMLKEATEETRPHVEARIREENPEAFHVVSGVHETLSQRHFQHEPCSPIPMAGFVRAYVPPPPPPTKTETETEAAPLSKDEKEAKANEQKEGVSGKDVEVSAEVEAAAGTDSEPVSVE
ncbi:hypothetical protein [Caballeronia sp. ATUFL_F1_KS4A]|uniref:hypothetical protein n=1 Tax=Caballeronia sp. ATUFL_F1_KS4A TaxID=2921768 RepID=UPI002028F638|nr:hypothetical protein [Caballeronia sp. ATUFL_F1_KS4A]